MKNVIKKSALYGLVGVPVFMVSVAVSNGIVKGVAKSIKKIRNK